jgi:CheY-like chemotaxis protein
MDESTDLQPRILVVEDDLGFQRLLELSIKRLGCLCNCCADGRSALAFIESYPYDLVFLDIHIPELDGFMVACQLRDMGYTVPLIAISALKLEGIERKAKAVGFTEFFQKPIEQDQIQRLLEQYATKHKTHS